MESLVDGDTTVPGDVELPAHLAHKTHPEGPDLVAGHRDHLVGVEGETLVVQRARGQLGEDVPAVGALQGQHPHVLGPVLQAHVEPLVLQCGSDVRQVLIGRSSSRRNVKPATLR